MTEGPPLPTSTPLTRALSEALRQGLALQQCRDCRSFVYFPRVACPECWSPSLDWMPISGDGVLQSFATIHRSLHPAFAGTNACVCAVQLMEGPVVIGLLDLGPDVAPTVGMRVRAVRREIAGAVFVLAFVAEHLGPRRAEALRHSPG